MPYINADMPPLVDGRPYISVDMPPPVHGRPYINTEMPPPVYGRPYIKVECLLPPTGGSISASFYVLPSAAGHISFRNGLFLTTHKRKSAAITPRFSKCSSGKILLRSSPKATIGHHHLLTLVGRAFAICGELEGAFHLVRVGKLHFHLTLALLCRPACVVDGRVVAK